MHKRNSQSALSQLFGIKWPSRFIQQNKSPKAPGSVEILNAQFNSTFETKSKRWCSYFAAAMERKKRMVDRKTKISIKMEHLYHEFQSSVVDDLEKHDQPLLVSDPFNMRCESWQLHFQISKAGMHLFITSRKQLVSCWRKNRTKCQRGPVERSTENRGVAWRGFLQRRNLNPF